MGFLRTESVDPPKLTGHEDEESIKVLGASGQ